jgi:hypothetical protein
MSMLDITHPERLEAFWDELQRLIHNYGAASYSLIRHATVFVEHESSRFQDDYRPRMLKVANAPVAQVFKGLRNLVQHRSLPAVGLTSNLAAKSYEGSNVVWLNSQQLLLSKGTWSAPAKDYLRQHDPLILADAIADYSSRIKGLYDWMFGEFETLHRAEVVAHDHR